MQKFFDQLTKACQKETEKNFYIHDMHTKEKIGTSGSLNCAIVQIQDDLRKADPDRCYHVYQGPIENNQSVWFGDSWDVQQYLQENAVDSNRSKEAEALNQERLFRPMR